MGGHGGLNILPQKRWNVYNFDNREKVRKDEEEAAKEEQLKHEQSVKRDAEFRLLQLRRARGLDPDAGAGKSVSPVAVLKSELPEQKKSDSDSKHINLFDGIKIFDPVVVEKKREHEGDKRKKMKKEEVRVVGPEDEVYRLGYGVAGKGVKAPWYTMKRVVEVEEDGEREERENRPVKSGEKRKKTVEELREERLKREKTEKERERALLMKKSGARNHGDGSGYLDRYYQRGRHQELERRHWC